MRRSRRDLHAAVDLRAQCRANAREQRIETIAVELTARALRAVSGVAHVRQLEVVERATQRLAETG